VLYIVYRHRGSTTPMDEKCDSIADEEVLFGSKAR